MIEIVPRLYSSKTGKAFMSDEVYEVVSNNLHFKRGVRVRLLSDEPIVEKLGEHYAYGWVTVTPHDSCIAEYCGVPKASIRLLKQ